MRLFLSVGSEFLVVFLAVFLGPTALASAGRSLPAGVENPAVVEKVYTSPRGEVQFVAVAGGHSAFLRNNKGALAALKEARGPSLCDEWLVSPKSAALPAGCDFYFHDEEGGGLYSVRSEEMEEASLFQVVNSAARRAVVAL